MSKGPIVLMVIASIKGSRDFADRDGALMRDERDYVADIADVLGASVYRSMMASLADTLTTAGL